MCWLVLLFFSFNESIVLTEILHAPHLGAVGIGMMYVVSGLSCFFVMPVINRIGCKYTMFCAGAFYVLQIAGLIDVEIKLL
jgi:hypothetical protein